MGISTNNEMLDIDLSKTAKRKVRVDGDNNKILELNLSDLSIVSRFNEVYPKLNDLQKKIATLNVDEVNEETMATLGNQFKEIDTEMRELIDYLFDANVSELCAPSGSMYDPIDGMFRYEHIIERISPLYEANLNEEMKKMKAKVEKRAAKYKK